MVFFLGCDVAKTKIDVSLVNEQGIEQWADKVPNEVLSIATALLTFAGAYPIHITLSNRTRLSSLRA